MPLILRSVLGTKLSISQMDGNLTYLAGTLSGSVIQVTGSSISAPLTAITASVVSASFTGSLFGTASRALAADKIKTVNVGGAFGITYPLLGSVYNGDALVYTIESPDFKYDVTNNLLIISSLSGSSLSIQGTFNQGSASLASGLFSHVHGFSTTALGDYSHTEGLGTIASGSYQHVQGKYNTQGDSTSLLIVGNGTSNGSRSDAFKVKQSGSLVLPTTKSAAPTWTGVDGEMIFATVSGNYLFYVWMNGAWRSGSLA